MSRSKLGRFAHSIRPDHFSDQSGFTLVEMLIAVAITLVMMASVVTLFANITESVRARRATMEMSAQLRRVRNMLQQDLEGYTCPGVTWQDPSTNPGYMEFIEGQYRDTFPSMLTDGRDDSDDSKSDVDGNGTDDKDELDRALSMIPRANGGTFVQPAGANSTTVNSLGDYDDILMFTSRNEHEPFVGKVPDYNSNSKGYTTLESPLAEVIWFAIENPLQEERARAFFGEPGLRTIYRRALIVAPWFDPFGIANAADSRPGVVRLLRPADYPQTDVTKALAALIRFQDEFDLSVRLEWDATAVNGTGQWKIVANSLADLTKRENRFGHYQYHRATGARQYPYAITSAGTYSTTGVNVQFVVDPDPSLQATTGTNPMVKANLVQDPASSAIRHVASYTVMANSYDPQNGRRYGARPFAYLDTNSSTVAATANVMLNDERQIVRVVNGPVPLWGPRRGEDVMITDVLAFDLRVFDPAARPVYQRGLTSDTSPSAPVITVEPADPGWRLAYDSDMRDAFIGNPASSQPAFVGQGAYVDMGYIYNPADPSLSSPSPRVLSGPPLNQPWILPWFADPHGVANVLGYAVYDTWSTSFENNGIDEDGVNLADQATNGLDDLALYPGDSQPTYRFGPDDVGERETAPPYDKPLRGVRIVLRVYERDSRQIRQVRVDRHFLTE